MFNFEDSSMVYQMIYPDNTTEEMSSQSLWEFFLLSDNDINCSFDELIKKLDDGQEIVASYNDFDWNMGTPIYKGKCKIKKLKTSTPQVGGDKKCFHVNKYIVQNFSGGTRYWVCPDCKADLGDT
jgi:hypothetical protein